jgi:hypothetical protein
MKSGSAEKLEGRLGKALADEELSFPGLLSTYEEQKMRLGLLRMTEIQCFGTGSGRCKGLCSIFF